MINNVTLVGRLTKSPELKTTQSGISVANFTIAVNRRFKNAEGQYEADFINVIAWRKTAEYIVQYAGKGQLVGLTGSIQTRNYENQQGVRVYITEVIADNVSVLERRKDESAMTTQNSTHNVTQNESDTFSGAEPLNISDDDLPF